MKKFNYHSHRNQDICGKLVAREVLACQSMVVEELIGHEILYMPDTNPTYEARLHNGWFEGNEAELEAKREELKELKDLREEEAEQLRDTRIITAHYEMFIEPLEDDLINLDEAEPNYPEVFEWWLVSDWFAQKLDQEGECVLEEFGCSWWGRQCTGQAIKMDHVIGQIAEEMEILEGQKNEWK